jgi:putative copper resistance protein D
MLGALLDSFGFVSVVLRGAGLASHALLLGGIIFLVWILGPVKNTGKFDTAPLIQSCRRLVRWSALAFALIQCSYLAANSAVLIASENLRFRDVVGANFFLAGAAGVVGAIVIAALTRRDSTPYAALLIPAAITLGSLVVTSHAAGRLEGRVALLALNALHQVATAAWIGGLPYLWLGLRSPSNSILAQTLCRRFSRMAMASVVTLALAGFAMAFVYVGSPEAIYGTAYGLMVASKTIMMGGLLVLGALNFAVVRRLPGSAGGLPRVRRLVEAELGVGLTVILAAASLGSQPPAADLRIGRVSASEIAQRISPQWPRLETPPLSSLTPASPLGGGQTSGLAQDLQSLVPGASSYTPSSPGDIAWSEYNHHWAGVVVLIAGLLAAASRFRSMRWARHWPLAFMGLAVFLFLRADPENWPLGPRGFWESFAVAEVLQHRLFVLLVIAFAIFQWGVETGRISSHSGALVFPAVCAVGGALLLTHSHSLGNIKEELLAELSHTPLAILGATAGWTRWLELRMPGNEGRRVLDRIWPVCFVLIGLILLNYREG